ncbi:MAG TPA: hypothetical protein VE978_01565 [Chitinophagales bacterium]|nr:hypothetical protein [Chitinophagales bacterium]
MKKVTLLLVIVLLGGRMSAQNPLMKQRDYGYGGNKMTASRQEAKELAASLTTCRRELITFDP